MSLAAYIEPEFFQEGLWIPEKKLVKKAAFSGIEKRVPILPTNPETGWKSYQAYFPEDPRGFEKSAGEKDYMPELREFLSKLKPENLHVYCIINALGSTDWYPQNSNGDIWPESGLSHDGDDYGFRSFLKAKVFRHHNHAEGSDIGDVLFSGFNRPMHRVELVARVSKSKAPRTADKIANGEFPATSMGARVEHDICSWCDHKAKKVAEYCGCLQDHMGEIREDGVKCGAINPKPNFFDISEVLIGADKTSWVMAKVAGEDTGKSWWQIPAWKLAEIIPVAEEKAAEIEKKIPGMMIPAGNLVGKKIKQVAEKAACLGKPIPEKIFDRMLKEAKPVEIFSTLAYLGIPVKPEEFQYVLLSANGHQKIAHELGLSGSVFHPSPEGAPVFPFGAHLLSEGVAKLACEFLKTRSVFHPFLVGWLERARGEKLASQRLSLGGEALPILSKIARAYTTYKKSLSRLYTDEETREEMQNSGVVQSTVARALGEDNPFSMKTASFFGKSELSRKFLSLIGNPEEGEIKIGSQSIHSRIGDLPVNQMSPEALKVLDPDDVTHWLLARIG